MGLLGSCHYQVTFSAVAPDQSLPRVLRNATSNPQMCARSSRARAPSPATSHPHQGRRPCSLGCGPPVAWVWA